ncbi:MAG: sigma-70 family RNA polymerase sigma factor [Myxococcaceae bacterium]|nr:sigma-70 family RNA polymerase sigma factor [Myxococcaceae bacterium]
MNRAQATYAMPASDDAMIERYASLIDRVARKLSARVGRDLADDLWSVGALGLLEAARRYDASRAVRFESFAEHRIRGAMLDELRKMDHLPRRLRADTERVDKARGALGRELGREPTLDELAARLGITIEDLAELEQLRQPLVPLVEALELASAEDGAEARLDKALVSRRLANAIGQLDQRLQLLLSLYYVEELTFREVARLLEVSEARVCQLHADALRNLRGLLSTANANAA